MTASWGRAVWACGLAATLGGAAALGLGAGTENGEWRYYSGDNGARKYSPLDQINKDNVSQLRVAWRSPAVDPVDLAPEQARPSNLFRSTPIMVNGVLYASNGVGSAIALDPATGQSIWRQPPDPETPPGFTSNRGLAYWSDRSEARILSHRTHYLYALDPKTGARIKSFGQDGRIDLSSDLTPGNTYAWTSTPLVVRDVVVMGMALGGQDSARQKEGEPGHVRAYDVRTGKLRWTFHVIPQGREPGVETWEEEAWRYTGAGNVWSLMSADDDLGYVYIPTTSATHDMYGGHRLGSNLYSTSIVCVDAKTGKRVWHYQTVHHDLFDYDNPSAPVVMDLNIEGRGRVKAVVQVTKQGFAFVLDRTNGKPVWPIEERPVPKSDVPGEQSWPTQPFPTKPPPVEWQGVTEDLLIDFTPELRKEALEIVKHYVIGPLFTPPSIEGPGVNDKKGTIQNPGSVGGPDWTGSAFDPDTQTLYVHSMTNPFVANLVPGDPKDTNLRYRASRRQLIDGPQGLPLLKPPYGRITALDLGKGTLRWTIAHGDGPRDHPAIKHLNLPPLGDAVRSAPLVTKTLLFATEGDALNIRVRPGMGGKTFWAYDKATGERAWKIDLEAGATGAPMTYLHQGKQYIVFAIGSPRHAAEFVALGLP